MPDEKLIAEIETLLADVVELGAAAERTRMVPNLLVTDASPSGLTGFVTIADDRDGDNILAKKVPGIIYSTNDLVNVLFVRGGEAIAFQQGSQSTNAGMWQVVDGTSTDIYYNSGDVGIGKSVAPDARLELLDASQTQLRLTHTEDTKFADFTLDTNHDLTITPSSTGQIILQPTTDSTDFFQVLDADGGTPILNVDSTNERVGIGTDAPAQVLDVVGSSQLRISNVTTDATQKIFRIQGRHYTNAQNDVSIMVGNSSVTTSELAFGGGDSPRNAVTLVSFWTATTNTSGAGSERMRITSAGDVGIGTTGPNEKVEIANTSGAHLRLSNGAQFVNFTVDATPDLTITPSSSGAVIFQPSSDQVDFFRVIDAGSTATFDVDTTNNLVGIGTNSPNTYMGGTKGIAIRHSTSPGLAWSNTSGRNWLLYKSGDDFRLFNASDSDVLAVQAGGNLGINGVTSPSTELDIGAGAIEFDEMTAPGAGAANTARLYAADNGAGKTQLIVIFNTGAAQVLATQP